jgi:hypothetical protein
VQTPVEGALLDLRNFISAPLFISAAVTATASPTETVTQYMKQLFMLIVLAAGGYLAYTFYETHYLKPETQEAEEITPSTVPEPSPGVPSAPPKPTFKSKVPGPDNAASGEKHVAPPGVFYMLERISAETKNGIVAVVPGDEVKLLKRTGDVLKVTIGTADFDVKASQVTDDLDVARAVEKKEFQRRTGQR